MIPMPSSASTDTTMRSVVLVPDSTPDATLVPFTPEEDQAFLSQVDTRTGAPLNIRAAMAAVRRPAQKLEILRKIDPKAAPYGKDNFVYTPPGSTFPVVVDPEGYHGMREVGKDLVEGLPGIGEMVGSILGGGLGGVVGTATMGPGAGTAAGAVLGAGGVGAGARDATERVMRAVTGTPDPRSTGEKLTDLGTSAAVSGLGEGAARVAAPVGKIVAGRLAESPAAILAREAAQQLKVPLSAGMQTGSRFLRAVEGIIAATPTGTSPMMGAVDNMMQAARGASNRIVERMAGGGSTHPAGFTEVLQAAAQGRISRTENVIEAMNNRLGVLVPKDTPIPLNGVEAALSELRRIESLAPEALTPQVSTAIRTAEAMLNDAAASGTNTLPYEAVQMLRTAVGEAAFPKALAGSSLPPGSTQNLQKLYWGIADDMREGARLVDASAKAAGLPSPGAEQAMQMRDAFVKLNRDPSNPVGLEAMEAILKASPTDPLKWSLKVTRDPRIAKAVRGAVTPKEWDTMAASIFEDMGRPTVGSAAREGEEWSASTFYTNWKALRPEGRNALFGGTRYADVAKDIDYLATVAQTMKEGGKYANTSGTARPLIAINQFLGPLMTAAGGGAAALGSGTVRKIGAAAIAPWAAAKLLTNPTGVKLVVGAVKVARGAPGKLPGYLARIVTMSRSDPALAKAVDQWIAVAGANGMELPDANDVLQLNTGQPNVQFTPR